MAPITQEKFDAFIVDSEIDTRMRLRQATSSVTQFGKIHVFSSTRECSQRFQVGGDHCDVVFLSSKFDTKDVQDFIHVSKETKTGQDTAYILVLGARDQGSGVIANNVMIGVDGFLFEPYSVDQLVEITTLSAKVRKERSAARERIGLTLLLTDIINQVDLVAYLKGLGHEPGTSMKKLKELTHNLGNLSPESFQVYVELAIKIFSEAPVPKKAFKTDNYKGASSRVKRKADSKVVSEAEAAFKAQAEAAKANVKGN